MSVGPRYRRRTFRTPLLGAISQCPFAGLPSSAAKHAPESNRGMHSQSIEPVSHQRGAPSVADQCVVFYFQAHRDSRPNRFGTIRPAAEFYSRAPR